MLAPHITRGGARFQRVARWLGQCTGVSSCIQPDWAVIAAFLLVYLPGTVWMSLARPLWLDEIMTLYVARLPLFGGSDAICARAASGSPLMNALVHGLLRVFPDPLALRLPAVLGFLAMSVAVFLFVRRRCSLGSAAVAMILPGVTAAYRYAWEGRPYGLLLGEVALAAWCWQCAAAGRRRRLSLMLLALTVAAAGYAHPYGVVALAPVMFGEAVRCLRSRRVDAAVWASYLAGALLLLPYVPTIRQVAAFHWTTVSGASYFGAPSLESMVRIYMSLISPLAIPGVALMIVAALAPGRRDEARPRCAMAAAFPPHEIAMAAALAAFPAILFTVSLWANGVYVLRHTVAASIGLAILAALLLERSRHSLRWIAAVLLAVGFLPQVVLYPRISPVASHKLLSGKAYEGEAIVVAEGLEFMQLSYYAPPDLRKRLAYVLVPPQVAARYTDPTNDFLVRTMLPCASLNAVAFERFVEAHPTFFVYRTGSGAESIVDYLLEQRRHVELAGKDGEHLMFRVTR